MGKRRGKTQKPASTSRRITTISALPGIQPSGILEVTVAPQLKRMALLEHPWWQGIAGIAQILAAVIAVLAVLQVSHMERDADRMRREAARPTWLVSGIHRVDNEHGRGFRIGLVNAGGAAVTVQDVGFKEGVKGCWVVQAAYPYSVPVGVSTEVVATCKDGVDFGGDVLLVALTQTGEITVHSIVVSVVTKTPSGVVGGSVPAEATLIATASGGVNAKYPRPVGNLPP